MNETRARSEIAISFILLHYHGRVGRLSTLLKALLTVRLKSQYILTRNYVCKRRLCKTCRTRAAL